MGADNNLLDLLRELHLDLYDCINYNQEYVEQNRDEIDEILLDMIRLVRDD